MTLIERPTLAMAPRPKRRLSIIQFIRTAAKNSLATCDEELFETLFVRRDLLWYSLFVISDPEGIKRVLVDNHENYRESHVKLNLLKPALGNGLLTAEGEIWRRHRRLIGPMLSNQANATASAIVPELAERLAQHLLTLPADRPIDVGGAIAPTMRTVLSAILFGRDADEDNIFRTFKMYSAVPRLSDFFPSLRWITGPVKRRRPHESEFDAIIYKMIAEREDTAAADRQDLLSMLVSAQDGKAGEYLDKTEIRDEMATLIYGGLNTSLRAIVFVWYLLAMHPWAEAKLHAELDEVLGGRTPDAKTDIPRLTFTRKLLDETMRLYPPIPVISRTAVATDNVCRQNIPKGAHIIIAPWIVHRHHRLWDDPDRFDPERFSRENVASRPRHAYLPFSAGPRTCAANALARTEMTLIVATLAQRCRFRLVPGRPIEPAGAATLYVKGGMMMTVERREPPGPV